MKVGDVDDGANLGELDAELGRHWKLPEPIIAVLNYHHSTCDERATAGQPLVTMVNVAEKLLPTFGIDEPVPADISDDEWESLGIDPSRTDEVKIKVQKHIEDVIAAINTA